MKPTTLRNSLSKGALAAALLLAVAAPLHSQQVRTVQDETAIRLDPDPNSPVIATLPAGTDLAWVGESGAWYTVSLAGPGADDLLGYVLASEVQVLGGAGAAPSAPGSGAGLPGQALPSPGGIIPDAQLQWENERSRRSGGSKKILWGLFLIGASRAALDMIPALQVPDPNDYGNADEYQSALDRRDAAETGRSIASGLGAALLGWGAIEFVWGWRRMSALEVDLPRRGEASLEEQYADANQMRSSGRSKFFWGLFLVGASHAALEWIPYLGVPDPTEYTDADEYQSVVDRRDRAETVRQWVTVGGGALGLWGGTQWVRGARRMSQIEATARMATLGLPLGTPGDNRVPELFVDRNRGRTQLGLQWTW